jgi:hypothetical protein
MRFIDSEAQATQGQTQGEDGDTQNEYIHDSFVNDDISDKEELESPHSSPTPSIEEEDSILSPAPYISSGRRSRREKPSRVRQILARRPRVISSSDEDFDDTYGGRVDDLDNDLDGFVTSDREIESRRTSVREARVDSDSEVEIVPRAAEDSVIHVDVDSDIDTSSSVWSRRMSTNIFISSQLIREAEGVLLPRVHVDSVDLDVELIQDVAGLSIHHEQVHSDVDLLESNEEIIEPEDLSRSQFVIESDLLDISQIIPSHSISQIDMGLDMLSLSHIEIGDRVDSSYIHGMYS